VNHDIYDGSCYKVEVDDAARGGARGNLLQRLDIFAIDLELFVSVRQPEK
jgi:hypothetical protein